MDPGSGPRSKGEIALQPSTIIGGRRFILLLSFVLLFSKVTFSPGALGFALTQPSHETGNSAKQETAQMKIVGMTCAPCAKGLEVSFRRMAGVLKADVDYKSGTAMIVFDPAKQSLASLSARVVASGYQVKEVKAV
jgi:Cu+-exporting ATPase